MKVVFAVLLVGWSSQAVVPLVGDPQSLECAEKMFLGVLLPRIVEGRGPVRVGTYDQFVSLSVDAGFEPKVAEEVTRSWQEFLERASDPVVSTLKGFLDLAKHNPQQLLISVLGSERAFKERTGFFALNLRRTPDKLNRRSAFVLPKSDRNFLLVLATHLPAIPADLLLRHAFIAAFSSYLSGQIINEWVEANNVRVEKSLSPDLLFQAAAIRADEHVKISVMFEELFGLLVALHIEERYFAFAGEERDESYRQILRMDLQKYRKSIEPLLTIFGLRDDQVLELGLKLTERMQQTIGT